MTYKLFLYVVQVTCFVSMDILLLRSKFDDLCIIPYDIQIAVVVKVIFKGPVYSHSQCLCGIFYYLERYFEKQTLEVSHSVYSNGTF